MQHHGNVAGLTDPELRAHVAAMTQQATTQQATIANQAAEIVALRAAAAAPVNVVIKQQRNQSTKPAPVLRKDEKDLPKLVIFLVQLDAHIKEHNAEKLVWGDPNEGDVPLGIDTDLNTFWKEWLLSSIQSEMFRALVAAHSEYAITCREFMWQTLLEKRNSQEVIAEVWKALRYSFHEPIHNHYATFVMLGNAL